MEFHRPEDLPGGLGQPHPDLSQSVPLAPGESPGLLLADNIMEHPVTMSLGKITVLSPAAIYK